jgi:ribosomal protein RSM22 (predicted rRNA methylase)
VRNVPVVIVLPGDLGARLDGLARSVGLRRLSAAAADLGATYRATGAPGQALTDLQAAAYAVYRMPATYAAVRAALGQLRAADPLFVPTSVVDVGAGTGAVAWAVRAAFGSAVPVRAVEPDRAMRTLGMRLAPASTIWLAADIADVELSADLVIAGYAVGEVADAAALADRTAAADTVLIVEPGTPRGYATVLTARSRLTRAGMTVAAPCPQSGPCPLVGRDWCHFAVRLERPAVTRQIKDAERGHEDEKFSFVAASRRPVGPAGGRILRHPRRHGGHVGLRVCAPSGAVDAVTVSRRDREHYRAARSASWGDPWPPASAEEPGGSDTAGTRTGGRGRR